MAEFANVESVEAIARFRVALIQFEEEATGTLDQLERQAQKFLHWLEADTANFWRMEVLRCHEKISRARSALDTAMMRKTKDFRPACIEEKDNLRLAKDRLYKAEEKTEKVRRWARLVREEVEEYRGKLNRLRDCLGIQVPRGLAVLDRTLRALEKYTELAPPPGGLAADWNSPGQESLAWNKSSGPLTSPAESDATGDSPVETGTDEVTNGPPADGNDSPDGMVPGPAAEQAGDSILKPSQLPADALGAKGTAGKELGP